MKPTTCKQRAVVCLAAGASQVPVIAKAQQLGYTVFAIDRNANAPGFKFADYKIIVSTYDAEAIIRELTKRKDLFEWCGVVNRSSGPPVVTAAKICKFLQIPGVPVESAINLVNKDKMRAECLLNDIPTPQFRVFDVGPDLTLDIGLLPAVVKPGLSLVGKSGVSVIRTEGQIEKAIEYAASNTINSKYLVEEYIDGPDLSLISFVNEGRLYPVCVLEEINSEETDGKITATGYKTLDKKLDNLSKQAKDIAGDIVSIFNLERSAFMLSFRADNESKLRLIEVHLDIGGDLMIEAFFPRALSFDFVELAVEMAVGCTENYTDVNVKPTAILYEKGDGLLTERPYVVITAPTDQALNDKIYKTGLKI